MCLDLKNACCFHISLPTCAASKCHRFSVWQSSVCISLHGSQLGRVVEYDMLKLGGWVCRVLKLDGWVWHVLKLDGWVCHVLKLDGWVWHVSKLGGWVWHVEARWLSVTHVELDGWVWYVLKLCGWVRHMLKQCGWTWHTLKLGGWVRHMLKLCGWARHVADEAMQLSTSCQSYVVEHDVLMMKLCGSVHHVEAVVEHDMLMIKPCGWAWCVDDEAVWLSVECWWSSCVGERDVLIKLLGWATCVDNEAMWLSVTGVDDKAM